MRRLQLISLAWALFSAVSADAGNIRLGNVDARLTVAPSSAHSVRVTLAPTDVPLSGNDAVAKLLFVDQQPSAPTVQLQALDGEKTATVGSLRVTVANDPLAIHASDLSGTPIDDIRFDTENGGFSFGLGSGPILGLGEGAHQFDRRGSNYPLRNGQGGDRLIYGARVAVPLVIGTSGWALLVVSPQGSFDLTGDRGKFQPAASKTASTQSIDLLIFDCREPSDLMREISQLTGPAVMPPKWSLGFMQSHRTLENSSQMVGILDTFRKKQLPCDALIYLGTGFCPAGWNNGHDSLDFNPKVFDRDPASVIQAIHDRNAHIVLHVVPKYPTLHGSIPPANDETLDATHIASYWHRHEAAFKLGVDGWWPDEGDWYGVPERFARHRMYYEGPLSTRPNERPWSLHRNGYLGTARYGGWIWSGDVASSWKALDAQVSVGLNYSLSLSPYWGTDCGGFIPTKDLTGELFVRWFQFSTFCPSFRAHGKNWALRLPWGWNTGSTGVVESKVVPAEEELHNAQVEPICRQYLNLRYQLMPYTYTLAREAFDSGMPLMRPLWLHYPNDPQAVGRGDEYLWGRDILVAPVVENKADSRTVYLPQGEWYDWWNHEKLTGGREVRRQVDLRTMPIYVRAGAIIPFDPVRQYVNETVSEPTELQIYPGADGRLTLYDDDGKSLDYLHGTGNWITMTWNDRERTLSIAPDPRSKPPTTVHRTFKIHLLPDGPTRTVDFSGKPVTAGP